MRSLSTFTVIALGVASMAWLPFGRQEATKPASMEGLWERADLPEDDDVRFYYFHSGGIGLYRYGKTGLNHTYMFSWSLERDQLSINVSKSGKRHEMRVIRGGSGNDAWIELQSDPWEDGRSVRYVLRPAAGPKSADFGRMWSHTEVDARGPNGFAMYQFQEPDAQGRGTGWFHVGDFDAWSTESLTYARDAGRLTIGFDLLRQRTTTAYRIRQHGDLRLLQLDRDPRGYWQRRTFVDRGPSFAAAHGHLLSVGL